MIWILLKKRTLRHWNSLTASPVAADGKDGHRLKLEKVAPFLKCYNCNKSSQRASYPGALAAGREKKGELATRLWNLILHLQLPCGSPSTKLSDFRQSVWSGKERECKHVPRIITSLPMSSPPISISHRLFRSRYSNSRNVVASSPPFSRPVVRAPQRPCSQAIKDPKKLKWFSDIFYRTLQEHFVYG